jgi:hypothetical protein
MLQQAMQEKRLILSCMVIYIYIVARDVRRFLGSRGRVLQKLESWADQIGREKRSHAEVVEGTSGQDGDCACANANGVCAKKARAV